jgi:hypothetical protein
MTFSDLISHSRKPSGVRVSTSRDFLVPHQFVLTAQIRSGLESKLKDFEAKSSIQLVVATVKSLNSSDKTKWLRFVIRGCPNPPLAKTLAFLLVPLA